MTVSGRERGMYRFPNLMGHSRPKYNSAVSTFCWAVANDQQFTVNDRNAVVELLYGINTARSSNMVGNLKLFSGLNSSFNYLVMRNCGIFLWSIKGSCPFKAASAVKNDKIAFMNIVCDA